jgi:hypothetical protein
MGVVMRDDEDDIRWMTYAELGKVREISTASATRLSFRRKWRRQGGNDGVVRVAVPLHEAKPHSDKTPDDGDDDRGYIIRTVSTLEVAVSTLREQLERERGRTDRAEERAGKAEEGREVERKRANQAEAETGTLRLQLEQARREAQDAISAAEALRQADAARRRQGVLARVVAAWRGE